MFSTFSSFTSSDFFLCSLHPLHPLLPSTSAYFALFPHHHTCIHPSLHTSVLPQNPARGKSCPSLCRQPLVLEVKEVRSGVGSAEELYGDSYDYYANQGISQWSRPHRMKTTLLSDPVIPVYQCKSVSLPLLPRLTGRLQYPCVYSVNSTIFPPPHTYCKISKSTLYWLNFVSSSSHFQMFLWVPMACFFTEINFLYFFWANFPKQFILLSAIRYSSDEFYFLLWLYRSMGLIAYSPLYPASWQHYAVVYSKLTNSNVYI